MSVPSKGFESLIHLLDSLEQKSSQKPNDEDADTEQINEASIDAIKGNIESTKVELKAKEEKLESLKAVFARKKLSNQRRLEKLKREWQEKSNESFIEFQKKEEEMNALYQQSKTDVENLKRRITDEYATIRQIVSSRDESCQKYAQRLEQNYIDTYNQWRVQEKQRLERLARVKSNEMKKDAARALEPELRNIVEDHKMQMVQLKQENDSKLSLLKERLTEEYDDNFRVLQQTLEAEQESTYLEMENKYEQQLEKQALHFEKTIESLSASMRLEREDMKKEHHAKMELLMKQHREELQEWAKQHETLVKTIHMEHQQRLETFTVSMQADREKFQIKMESELKKWEIEEGNRLESLYRNRLESETLQLKTEINNKIEMIKVKLKENLETTKLRIHSQLEKERQDMESEKSSEVNQILSRFNENSNIDPSELLKLKTELQLEKDKLFDIESAVALRNEALQKSITEQNMKEATQIKSLEDQLVVITSAEKELEQKKKIVENKILLDRKILKDKVIQRTMEMNKEFDLVNDKFDVLLKNREDMLGQKKKVLSELIRESKDIEDKIKNIKKRLLC